MKRVITNTKNAIGEDPLGVKAEFIRIAGIANTLLMNRSKNQRIELFVQFSLNPLAVPASITLDQRK